MVIHPDTLDVWTHEDAHKYFDDHHSANHYWTLIQRIQDMDLTREEQAVATALTLLMSDIEASRMGAITLDVLQENLCDAFIHLLRRNHENGSMLFARYISVLCELRTLDVVKKDVEKKFMADFKDIDFPQIYRDLMNADSDEDK